MNTFKFSNIKLNDFRAFLSEQGCSREEGKGGHEKWFKSGMTRPIVLQSHIYPVPEFIIEKNLATLGWTKQQYKEYCLSKTKGGEVEQERSA